MIDALFGSKTRVKLLHLFLNNPDKSFYVREITRLIDEQINSVRRELSNMLKVGIITSDSSENKLYYKVNDKYEYYSPLSMIFAEDVKKVRDSRQQEVIDWRHRIGEIPTIRLAIASGILVPGSATSVDLILVGDGKNSNIKQVVSDIESSVGREINYAILGYDDFYYRMSVRDRFISEVLSGAHEVIVDLDNVLGENK